MINKQVDENMSRAQTVDAARKQKFFFRKFIAPPDLENDAVAKYCDEFRKSFGAEDASECDPNAVIDLSSNINCNEIDCLLHSLGCVVSRMKTAMRK